MNPHRLTWSFAYNMPFALIVALVTLVSLLISREPKKIPWTRETIVLLIFLAWMLLTTVNALYPAEAWPHLNQIWKIFLMVYLDAHTHAEHGADQSTGVGDRAFDRFYGVKGGIFTIGHGVFTT